MEIFISLASEYNICKCFCCMSIYRASYSGAVCQLQEGMDTYDVLDSAVMLKDAFLNCIDHELRGHGVFEGGQGEEVLQCLFTSHHLLRRLCVNEMRKMQQPLPAWKIEPRTFEPLFCVLLA